MTPRKYLFMTFCCFLSVLCDGERHLVCMQQASQCITRLQHKLICKEGSVVRQGICDRTKEGMSHISRESLREYSSLLASKLTLQAQMSVLLTELSRRQQKQQEISGEDLDDGEDSSSSQPSEETEIEQYLAKECLLFSHTYRDVSQDLRTGANVNLATSLAPRALISGELDFVWSKLKQEMRDCNSDDDRVCLMEQQLRDAHERLMERKHTLVDTISGYRDKEGARLLQALVTDKCVQVSRYL